MFQIVQFEGGEGPDVPVLEVDREGRHLSRLRIQVSFSEITVSDHLCNP